MIKGVDVSKWQGDIDFNLLKSAVDFAIIRSSYGTGYIDPKFIHNRDEARRVGIARGFYHYAYPTYNTPEAEAEWFANVIGTPQDGEILFLDFEEKYGDPVGWSKRFLDRLEQIYGGYKALIYMSESFIKASNWQSVFDANHGLWIAKYGVNNGSVPATEPVTGPWPTCAFWQYTSVGRVSGISTNVDMNIFYGSLAAFWKYAFHAPIVPPAPPAPEPAPTPPPAPEPAPVPPTPEPTPEPVPPTPDPLPSPQPTPLPTPPPVPNPLPVDNWLLILIQSIIMFIFGYRKQ